MIATVTPNLALDVTYEVPELRPGHAHRVRAVHSRAGGKGVNVARADLVISGSLPRGVDADAVARLAARDIPVIVDTLSPCGARLRTPGRSSPTPRSSPR